MQERYCQARALGEKQAEAARTAGASAAPVWASKTERKPGVKERIQALKRAAHILAEANGAGNAVTHSGSSAGNAALMAAIPAVADLAEVLVTSTDAMRRTGGKRIERTTFEMVAATADKPEQRTVVKETDDGVRATDRLMTYHVGTAAPSGNLTVNVAILQDPQTRQAVAHAARARLVEARRRG